MFFGSSNDSINSLFCDFSSSFWPKEEFFEILGYKWPDDFEKAERIGNAGFQLISDLRSELMFYNHLGQLYSCSESKILEKYAKVKEEVIVEKYGNRNPFIGGGVYLLETGFNHQNGDIEYITSKYNKEDWNSFSSFRKVVYRFPLFWLMWEVLTLTKQKYNKKGISSERIKILENEKIISHEKLKEWHLIERDVSPCMDVYRERVELPLRHYNFTSRDDHVHVWLKFEFFGDF